MRPHLEDPHGYNMLFTTYGFYRDGHFPDPGTWMDQSARLLALLQVISKAQTDAEEMVTQKKERQSAQAKRAAAQRR